MEELGLEEALGCEEELGFEEARGFEEALLVGVHFEAGTDMDDAGGVVAGLARVVAGISIEIPGRYEICSFFLIWDFGAAGWEGTAWRRSWSWGETQTWFCK